MENVFCDKIDSAELLSRLFEKVFGDICRMYDLSLEKPQIRPLDSEQYVMAFVGAEDPWRASLGVSTDEPLIVYSPLFTLDARPRGLAMALMLAHEIGHYAHHACALDPTSISDETPLRTIMAQTIIDEGIAVTFAEEYLQELIRRREIRDTVLSRTQRSIGHSINQFLEFVATPYDLWAMYRESRKRAGSVDVNRYTFTGQMTYDFGKRAVRKIRRERQLSMRAFLLIASSVLDCNEVQAAAARLERTMVSRLRCALRKPDLTSNDVQAMILKSDTRAC